MDKLDEIFKLQIEFQKKLHNENIVFNQEFISFQTLACIDELMEALRETNWKPWKKHQNFNIDNFRDELIDAFHFMVNLCLASGLTADYMYELFIMKNKLNNERHENDY